MARTAHYRAPNRRDQNRARALTSTARARPTSQPASAFSTTCSRCWRSTRRFDLTVRSPGRSARRPAPHGRRRRHLPRPGAASRRSATRPASAATGTSRCRWKRRWCTSARRSERPLLRWRFNAPVPSPQDRRLRQRTASKTSGTPFAANALCNLHVLLHYGRNSHHIAEAIFKATARALRMAVEQRPADDGRAEHQGHADGVIARDSTRPTGLPTDPGIVG